MRSPTVGGHHLRRALHRPHGPGPVLLRWRSPPATGSPAWAAPPRAPGVRAGPSPSCSSWPASSPWSGSTRSRSWPRCWWRPSSAPPCSSASPGLVAAGLATAVYVALRRSDIESAGAANFALLVVARAAAYGVVAVAGARARRLIDELTPDGGLSTTAGCATPGRAPGRRSSSSTRTAGPSPCPWVPGPRTRRPGRRRPPPGTARHPGSRVRRRARRPPGRPRRGLGT